jgi:tryptophan 2,3-dioxygenase
MENISLFELIEKWLERTPFLNFEDFSFWEMYKTTVYQMLDKERQVISENLTLSDEKKENQLKQNRLQKSILKRCQRE